MLCIAAHGAGTHTVAARGAPGCSLCPSGCSLRPSGCSLRPYGCSLHPYGCSLHPYGCRHDKLFMPETLRGELWERREAAEAQGDPDDPNDCDEARQIDIDCFVDPVTTLEVARQY